MPEIVKKEMKDKTSMACTRQDEQASAKVLNFLSVQPSHLAYVPDRAVNQCFCLQCLVNIEKGIPSILYKN